MDRRIPLSQQTSQDIEEDIEPTRPGRKGVKMKGGRPGPRRHICHHYSPGAFRAWEPHSSPPKPPTSSYFSSLLSMLQSVPPDLPLLSLTLSHLLLLLLFWYAFYYSLHNGAVVGDKDEVWGKNLHTLIHIWIFINFHKEVVSPGIQTETAAIKHFTKNVIYKK